MDDLALHTLKDMKFILGSHPGARGITVKVLSSRIAMSSLGIPPLWRAPFGTQTHGPKDSAHKCVVNLLQAYE